MIFTMFHEDWIKNVDFEYHTQRSKTMSRLLTNIVGNYGYFLSVLHQIFKDPQNQQMNVQK